MADLSNFAEDRLLDHLLGTRAFTMPTEVHVAAFTDPDTGRESDPTSVVCTVKSPGAVISTPGVSRASTGVYTAQLEVDAAGTWHYAFDGVGLYQAAQEGRFRVRRRYVTRDTP